MHAASGWDKHGKGYHNDANGLKAHEHGGGFHHGWASDIRKGYEDEGEKDYSKGTALCDICYQQLLHIMSFWKEFYGRVKLKIALNIYQCFVSSLSVLFFRSWST